MISRLIRTVSLLACLLPFAAIAAQDIRATEVYRDEYISISAEVIDLERKIVHFGDVLTLAMSVKYDPRVIRVQEFDSRYFSGAWPENHGPILLDMQSSIVSGSGQGVVETLTLYRFQVFSCPEGAVLCRGTRLYDVPEFSLEYIIVDADDDSSIVTAEYRPWPAMIMVASAIPLDEDGELNSFPTYFPTGAYPNPLAGADQEHPFRGLVAGGIFLLLGGLLMSPLSFFKRGSLAASRPVARWEKVLEKLKAGEFEEEAYFLDNLRRCVVWYCIDELGVDPFYWFKNEQEVSGDVQKGAGQYAEVKAIFVELSLAPQGEGKALMDRFIQYVSENK